jgi:Domain of unknown function (DUF4062)
MSTTVRNLTVFVASPSDVLEERTKVDEVVLELNTVQAPQNALRFDLVKWETHIAPGIGEDPQDVINKQIPNYDVFIGIMYCRFGSPTNRADSGTVEEFEQAKRHWNAGHSLKIMFYFKNEPIAPTDVDPIQLQKVQQFKDSLKISGVLYKEFTTSTDFEKKLRMDLSMQIPTWRTDVGQIALRKEATTLPEVVDEEDEEDEVGILEAQEIVEKEFATLNEIVLRIGVATSELGNQMRVRTDEINRFHARGKNDPKAAKKLLARVASDMEAYSEQIEKETPQYKETVEKSMGAVLKVAEFSLISENEDKTDLTNTISELKQSISTGASQVTDFRNTIAGLPPMTTEIIRSKKRLVRALDDIIREFMNTVSMLNEGQVLLTSAKNL